MANEDLTSVVQNHKVLYGKSQEDFHRKDIRLEKNAWNAEAEELGLEDGRFMFIYLFEYFYWQGADRMYLFY